MEQRDFITKGFERIKKYYTLPPDRRGAETGLPESPHEILLEDSAKIIDLGLYDVEPKEKKWEESKTFDYILIGVGTEILLKAIFLKEEPDIFIEKKQIKKLGFYSCKGWLIGFLRPDLPPGHLERVKDVLDLIQLKRNNLAHLGFHQMTDYRDQYQVSNVLGFLFLKFFKESSHGIVEKLAIVKDETKVRYGNDYESVEFDEYV